MHAPHPAAQGEQVTDGVGDTVPVNDDVPLILRVGVGVTVGDTLVDEPLDGVNDGDADMLTVTDGVMLCVLVLEPERVSVGDATAVGVTLGDIVNVFEITAVLDIVPLTVRETVSVNEIVAETVADTVLLKLTLLVRLGLDEGDGYGSTKSALGGVISDSMPAPTPSSHELFPPQHRIPYEANSTQVK